MTSRKNGSTCPTLFESGIVPQINFYPAYLSRNMQALFLILAPSNFLGEM